MKIETVEKEQPEIGKNLAAVPLGRLGRKKGRAARAAKVSAEERFDIAKIAAAKR